MLGANPDSWLGLGFIAMRIIPTPTSELGRAAMEYAISGYPVLPCRPRSKQPAIKDWPRAASADPRTVSRWWSREPEFNIGMLTGAPGPDVVDIDVRPGGDGQGFLALLRERGLLDGALRRVATPSGGEHWWFLGSTRRKCTPAPYVDFLAQGAFVLAPPSVLEIDGKLRHYRTTAVLAGPPTAFRWELLGEASDEPGRGPVTRKASRPRAEGSSPERRLALAKEGQRNNTLFSCACWMIRQGRNPWHLRGIGERLGLGPEEIENTIRSARTVVAQEKGR